MNVHPSILFYEGRFNNESHAKFNAAFTVAVSYAYPDHEILFRGHPNHIHEVRNILAKVNATTPQPIKWQDYQSKRGTRIGIKGFSLPIFIAVLDLINAIRKEKPRFVVILAALPPFTLLYKRLITQIATVPTLIIHHGELGRMLESNKATIEYQSIVQGDHRKITNIVLGSPILDVLNNDFPTVRERFYALSFPALWTTHATQIPNCLEPPLRFGLLGSAASHTGLELFLKTAQRYCHNPIYNFELTGAVGHLDQALSPELENVVPLSRTPISYETYRQRIASLTYGLGMWPQNRNRYAASLAFMDALDHGKPGLYLTNPIITDAFAQMGDIGYLCQDHQDMLEVLDSFQHNIPTKQYHHQQKTIVAMRDIYNAYQLKDEYRTTIDRFLAQAV